MYEIITEKINKYYGQIHALKDVSLEIEENSLFGLLGVNGAGKTTLIKILTCLIEPSDGKATVHGYSVTDEPREVKKIADVSPQETAVAPNLTVKENLDFFAALYGTDDKEYIASIIDGFSLGEVLSQRAKTLSGGWKRRVSIRSLKGKATIILTTHYLEEAEALCDKVAIMAKGEVLAAGTPEELKISAGTENFEDAFVKITEGDL